MILITILIVGIQKSKDEKSCQGLQRAYDASYQKGGMSDVMSFIDWHLNKLMYYI